MNPGITFAALTPAHWEGFVALFGQRGACAGCWCMYWRQRGRAWKERSNEANRAAMRRLVEQGPPPGVLAYAGDEAIGWCQIGPHRSFDRFVHSRTKQQLDEIPVWVVNCFFIARDWRGQGLMPRLLEAAVVQAHTQGARRVEGYPLRADAPRLPATFAYVGTATAFERAGFQRVEDPAGVQAPRYRRDLPATARD